MIQPAVTFPTVQEEAWQGLNRQAAVLIGLARDGDVRAFDKLYCATARWLLSRVRRIAGDAAEDVLAEVYLQVWKDLSSYDESRGEACVWLATIARSRALDHLRSEKARGPAGQRPADAEPTDTCEGPEQALSRAQDARLVHVSLATLDGDERLVVGLAYFRDCTQREISSATGLPIGTVKSLMTRAQRKLRNHFRCGSALSPADMSPEAAA